MSIQNFLDAAMKDPALAEKIESCKSIQDFVNVAAGAGYTITEEEVAATLKAEKKDISDADLGNVSGGTGYSDMSSSVEYTRRG